MTKTTESWEKIERLIEKILVVKPIYSKPGLHKESSRQIKLIHQKYELLELIRSLLKEQAEEKWNEINSLLHRHFVGELSDAGLTVGILNKLKGE